MCSTPIRCTGFGYVVAVAARSHFCLCCDALRRRTPPLGLEWTGRDDEKFISSMVDLVPATAQTAPLLIQRLRREELQRGDAGTPPPSTPFFPIEAQAVWRLTPLPRCCLSRLTLTALAPAPSPPSQTRWGAAGGGSASAMSHGRAASVVDHTYTRPPPRPAPSIRLTVSPGHLKTRCSSFAPSWRRGPAGSRYPFGPPALLQFGL